MGAHALRLDTGHGADHFRTGLRRHRVMAVLVAGGVLLRLVAELAYHTSLLYPDSLDYLNTALVLRPGPWHPIGYGLVLKTMLWAHNLAVYALMNHAAAVVCALLIYALLVRLGVRPWLGALATAPLLFGAYQLIVEQYLLADVTFELLVVMTLVVLMWRPRDGRWRPPSTARCLVVGALIAATALVRFNGAIVVVPVVAYLLWRHVRWWRAALVVAVVAATLVGYAGWYKADNGVFTLSTFSGRFLYGRVAGFADCTGASIPSYERSLCPTPPTARRHGPNWYVSSPKSPARVLKPHGNESVNKQLVDFDRRIILHQPFDYLAAVAGDAVAALDPRITQVRGSDTYPLVFHSVLPGTAYGVDSRAAVDRFGGPAPVVVQPWEHLLADYQIFVYTPGILFGLALGLALVAVLWRRRARDSGIAPECAVWAATGTLTFLWALATSHIEWRYEMPMLVTLPAAAALALTILFDRRSVPEEGRQGGAYAPGDDWSVLRGRPEPRWPSARTCVPYDRSPTGTSPVGTRSQHRGTVDRHRGPPQRREVDPVQRADP